METIKSKKIKNLWKEYKENKNNGKTINEIMVKLYKKELLKISSKPFS